MLHKAERRTTTTKIVRETEAEAIAFVVGKAVGLETGTASADYIQLYHGNASLLAESLEVIQQTSAVILAALQPPPQTAETDARCRTGGGGVMQTILAILRTGRRVGTTASTSRSRTRPIWRLVIEATDESGPCGLPAISVAHYGEQNGDLMRDPEMCFELGLAGGKRTSTRSIGATTMWRRAVEPHHRPRPLRVPCSPASSSIEHFARTWDGNLKACRAFSTRFRTSAFVASPLSGADTGQPVPLYRPPPHHRSKGAIIMETTITQRYRVSQCLALASHRVDDTNPRRIFEDAA